MSCSPPRPLFIIGNPRSGTSLLRLILTSHSHILIPPECGFIVWLRGKYAQWQLSDSNDPHRRTSFLNDLFDSKKFSTWLMDKTLVDQHIQSQQPKTYAELCGVVYAAFGAKSNKPFTLWGDKNNFHIDYLDELFGLYPAARFLHIVRDGRDVACSYREVMESQSASPYAPKLAVEIGKIATEWSRNVSKVDAFMSSLPTDSALSIRYEDLVLNPVPVVTAICEWLALPFETGMLAFHQLNQSQKLEPEQTLDWKKRTLQPISDETVKRYENLLSPEECAEFQAIAESVLRRFSYL